MKQPLPKLTRKQKVFVRELLSDETKSGTEAAMVAYSPNTKHGTLDPRNVAHSIASENMRKPAILAHLSAMATRAEYKVVETMDGARDERLRFDAARDILDRVHGKATQRVEVQSTALVLSIDMSGAASQELDTNERDKA